jgi:uncharacterized protein (TIGR03435 family)
MRAAAASVFCFAAVCQSPPKISDPAFVLADVHASAPPLRAPPQWGAEAGPILSNGIYQFRNATILDFIAAAYDLSPTKVIAGPRWLQWDKFDLNAQAPEGSSEADRRAMLRSLLSDRFRLVAHYDSRPVDGWVLSATPRSTSKLRLKASAGAASGCQMEQSVPRASATAPGDDPPPPPLRSYSCTNTTMSEFAANLNTLAPTYIQGQSVVDQTGLEGQWDFRLEFSRIATLASVPGGVTLQSALREELGLNLKAMPIPSRVLVVDSVDESPAADSSETVRAIADLLPSQFEVASVKASDPGSSPDGRPVFSSMKVTPGGGIDYRNVFFSTLMDNAFELEIGGRIVTADRMVGIPASLTRARFDIAARPPAQTSPSASAADAQPAARSPLDNEAAARMLRALLIDRFDIQYHVEVRQSDGYRLVAVNPKMRNADPAERTKYNSAPSASGQLAFKTTFQNMSLAEIADQLTSAGSAETQGHPIVDATGIQGRYDLTLDFSLVAGVAPVAEMAPPRGTPLTEALQRQAGLKLEKFKVPVKILVIDHIASTPKPN